jgi:hypothetical protein
MPRQGKMPRILRQYMPKFVGYQEMNKLVESGEGIGKKGKNTKKDSSLIVTLFRSAGVCDTGFFGPFPARAPQGSGCLRRF